jgi:hypothetical protein
LHWRFSAPQSQPRRHRTRFPISRGPGRERARRLSLAIIATILVRKRRPLRRAYATSRRPTSWRVKTAGSFGAARHPQSPTPRRSHSPGRLERQQDDRRCRHGRLFLHHSHLARPHGEVLHPKRHEPKQIDCRHLPNDGSGETVVIVTRTAPTSLFPSRGIPCLDNPISLMAGLAHQVQNNERSFSIPPFFN